MNTRRQLEIQALCSNIRQCTSRQGGRLGRMPTNSLPAAVVDEREENLGREFK